MKYNIDVNLTEKCSLRCKYCIENFQKPKLQNLSNEIENLIIDKVNYLINSEEFLRIFDGVAIFFWGGEPSLNRQSIIKFLETFKDKNVEFFLYSNGFELSKMFEIFKKYPKLKIQISYDGLASHNIDRVDRLGNGSALKVKENIFKLNELDIDYNLHPTISFNNLDKIAENYLEFERMSKILKKEFHYSPTLDYLSDHNFSKNEIKEFKKILTNEVKKIKNNLLDYYKKHGIFNFGWLNESKKMCNAGMSMSAVDLDGSIYACHGGMNSSKKLILDNIKSENSIYLENILKNYKEFKTKIYDLPNECKNCYSTYCLKCNAKKYEVSEMNKWNDYPNQPHLCEIFKHISKLRFVLLDLYPKDKTQRIKPKG